VVYAARQGKARVVDEASGDVCVGARFVLAESDIKRERWHWLLDTLKPDRS
jgi:hypothetical protein